ncbi:hypothetical protein [Melittangium boletus]|uniref:Uncharacterized protein n=1 Tax=Melittangium boletus DSM 14713 TaxID=1294270 RepID=A0A250IE64_9BACT|nr:hypothetical protein [Melittangium boletus]ATB29431.1 hypothetical protein MEBOL_002880 [Melittangium boletus DSM 14713]
MAGIRQDYITRMIEQLAAALAAILRAATGGKTEEALEQVNEASLSLFGMEYRMLITIDAGSVAELLGHPEKIQALAKLVLAEADVLRLKGDAEGVAHRLGHALGLLLETERRRGAPDAETEALLRDVRGKLAS